MCFCPRFPGLLKVAELLKVKGLVEDRLKEGRPDVSTSSDEPPRGRSSSKSNNNRNSSRDRSGERPASANGKDSSPPTPTSLPAGGPAGFMRNIMGTPPAGGPQFPMWPLPGIFPPGAHGLFGNGGSGLGGDRDRDRENGPNGNDKEDSPSPKEGAAKRKKTSSGSGGSTSSKDGSGSSAGGNGAGLLSLRDRAELMIDGGHATPSEAEKMMMENELRAAGENGLMGLPPGMDKNNIANYVPNQQRLEWKRYKQYTRNDIMAAIEEVKKGKAFAKVKSSNSLFNVFLHYFSRNVCPASL